MGQIEEEMGMEERKNMMLDDETIRELTEYVPFPEGAGLTEFAQELGRVKEALRQAGPEPVGKDALCISLLRGMYLLGVIRGAEAVRNYFVTDAGGVELPEMDFYLDDVCADLFTTDLNMSDVDDLAALLQSPFDSDKES